MPRFPHEIPTHLDVEDKAFFGLKLRQAMYLMSGLASSYGVLTGDWPPAPMLRLVLALFGFLGAAALALIQPLGRGLDEWAIVALRYCATPRHHVWRAIAPNARSDHQTADWAELAPGVRWRVEGR